MSLLDNVKKEEGAAVEAPKAAKKSNSEYQKKARAKALASAQLIRDELLAKKIELSAEGKEALQYLCKEGRAVSSAFGKPVIYKIFGDTPKKGDKVTALKVFELTGKGFPEMRQLMKKWDGVVTFDEASKSYIIAKDVPAYNA